MNAYAGFDSKKGMGGHHLPNEGVTDTWLTPPHIIEALGHFDLDPCCPPQMPWKTAETMWTIEDNGLMLPFFGRVFLNPPYGRETGIWLEKLAVHDDGVALVFARTETEMFHRNVWERARALLFLEGRLHFHLPNGQRSNRNAGAPSVLVAYGEINAHALAEAKIRGCFVPLRIAKAFLIDLCTQSWRDALSEFFDRCSEPVALGDLYRAFATHPKAKRNPNFQAKLRQTLQKGEYVRVAPGVWQKAVGA